MKYLLLETSEFREWLDDQPLKTQVIINARLERLCVEGHWGFINSFDGITELKWISGLRIYTAKREKQIVIILLGGNKNGQNKDIQKAKKLLKSYFS